MTAQAGLEKPPAGGTPPPPEQPAPPPAGGGDVALGIVAAFAATPALAALIATALPDVTGGIARTQVTALAAALESLPGDATPEQAEEAITATLGREWTARRTGVTETSRAAGHGVADTLRAEGTAATEWVTAADERVCPACAANEAAGPVTMGHPFPSGVIRPPAHVNCRCSTFPVDAGSVPGWGPSLPGWDRRSPVYGSGLPVSKGWAGAWLREARDEHGKWIGIGGLDHDNVPSAALRPGDVIRTRGGPGRRYAPEAREVKRTDHFMRVDSVDPAAQTATGVMEDGRPETVQVLPHAARVRDLSAPPAKPPAAKPRNPPAGPQPEHLAAGAARFRASGGTTENLSTKAAVDDARKELAAQLDAMKKAGVHGFARDHGVEFTGYAMQDAAEWLEDGRPGAGLLVARDKNGDIAGALNYFNQPVETVNEEGDVVPTGETAFYVDYLGTTGIAHGTGSALAAEAAGIAAGRGLAVVGEPTPDALPFWEKMGWEMDPTGTAGAAFYGWTAEQARAAAGAGRS